MVKNNKIEIIKEGITVFSFKIFLDIQNKKTVN